MNTRVSDEELAALFEHDETCGDESYTHLDSLIDGDPIELGRLCARLARELQERRRGDVHREDHSGESSSS